MPIYRPMSLCAGEHKELSQENSPGDTSLMSRSSIPSVALQQCLLPLLDQLATFVFVLSAVHQPVLTYCGTVHGSSPSQYTLSSVLRPAGLLSLNLRGRGSGIVPANGCLATLLLRWQCVRSRTVQNHIYKIAWGNSFRQVEGNLRFPLTVTYHGCPSSFPTSFLSHIVPTKSSGR